MNGNTRLFFFRKTRVRDTTIYHHKSQVPVYTGYNLDDWYSNTAHSRSRLLAISIIVKIIKVTKRSLLDIILKILEHLNTTANNNKNIQCKLRLTINEINANICKHIDVLCV